MKVVVTGANGYIGRAFCAGMLARGREVRGATRLQSFDLPVGTENVAVGDISEVTDWGDALVDVEVCVHLAARAHVTRERAVDPLSEFRRVNVMGSLNFARQAAAAGARRFLFLSSIGVNGAETFQEPFTAKDQPAPNSPYALSKYEAEIGLKALAADTGMEIVIIRPPLVYGPDAPGNFGSLMRWLRRGVPLPFGAIRNRRSLVSLHNLIDLMTTCLSHPAAAGETVLVSDGEDISTTELLRRVGRALGSDPRLIPVPSGVLKLAAAVAGKPELAQRLCGSLQVDIEATRRLLGWSPPITLDEGLKKAVRL
jgi:nucleoside-diphosphate-sugar epimerase